MKKYNNTFTQQAGIAYPIIGGAMYPCGNPELVAAVSEAGGIGIIQPVSIVYAHGYDFREGLRYMKSLTSKPMGINILVEKSSKKYEDRMKAWVDIAIEEGIKFFVTALGNPTWVIEKAKSVNGIVYHDVTNKKWAGKAVEYGVDGLICVNNRAGGHAGDESPAKLYEELLQFGLPLICAGGIGDKGGFEKALEIGYQGIQMGTRFIASEECKVHNDYHQAILNAKETDIVLSEKITGVPVAVINTPYIKKAGLKSGPLAKFLLSSNRSKHFMRMFYAVRSFWQLKRSMKKGTDYKEFFQAGKSVHSIDAVLPVKTIIDSFVN